VTVDTTDAARGIFHSHLVFPVTPGPLTLVYPKWIPGEHSPSGPIVQLVGLKLTAGGQPLSWRRDSVEMFAFHCEIPAGQSELAVSFDYLSPGGVFGGGYGQSPNATLHLVDVLWNQLVLYPQGQPAERLLYRASVRLPQGWQYGTALPFEKEDKGDIYFKPVSLMTLVDSPLVAGRYFRRIPLASDQAAPVQLDMVADSAAALEINQEQIEAYKKLVKEADALFGARHYQRYHFLLTLSDSVLSNGLEHHESTDIRLPESSMLNPVLMARYAGLLPHEYTHSWNGKYRRPAGLTTADYQQPMNGELLWVYEGLTRYLGDLVLTSRSNLRTPAQTREYLAWIAATQDQGRPGRAWRPLVDTAVSVQKLFEAPGEWLGYRRTLDYYDEGLLIWLEADALIRQRSGGTRSLDDFCRAFFGAPGGPPTVKPYTLDELVAALNAIAPFDWRDFLSARVYRVAPRAPLGGLEASGWKLVYTNTPNEFLRIREQLSGLLDFSFSLGMWLRDDGSVVDIVPGFPAYAAGLGTGVRVVGVNGRSWSPDALHEELSAAENSAAPLELLVVRGGQLVTYRLTHRAGERYPHLERDAARADLLEQILKPLT
jgi:predicted metalloprotease with PDZ domain